jgi:hypothetical protein
MNPIYLPPKIATLQHSATPYRGEWIIYQHANHEYKAVHEVPQLDGHRKAVESIALASLADAQSFSGYLGSYGWRRAQES